MSNVAVYKTSQLDISTNFTNQFLDGLLEQYCSLKFQENTVIKGLPNESGVPSISLDDLITFAYPGYYRKAPGLYGSLTSTQVIIVYEEHLHNTLQEALDHKLSRLFVKYNPTDVRKLYFVDYFPRSANWDLGYIPNGRTPSTRDFSREYRYLVNRGMLDDYCDKEFNIDVSDLSLDQIRTSCCLVEDLENSFVIYKPSSDMLHAINKTIRSANEEILLNSFFFRDERDDAVESYLLAVHFAMQTNLSKFIQRSVTSDFYENLIKRAKTILSDRRSLMLSYILQERAKEDESVRLFEAKQQAKKALEEASKKMAFKRDPESSENRKMKDIVYSEQIGGKESDADPSGTTVALVIIILIVLFIMGIALN